MAAQAGGRVPAEQRQRRRRQQPQRRRCVAAAAGDWKDHGDREDDWANSAGEGAAGEGHGAARGAEQAAAAPSTPGGASALAGSPPSGFDGFARQVLEALENQGKLLASLSEKQDSMSKTLDSQGQLLASQGKTLDSLKGVPATVGAVSENLVRVKRVVVGEDEEYRPRVLMTSDADVLRVCSTPDFPASKQRLVNELMAEHLAYTALLHLVLPQLKVWSGMVGMFAGWRGEGSAVEGVSCCVGEEDQ